MRVPFDLLPASELEAAFAEAEFRTVTTRQVTLPFILSGGAQQVVEVAYATPIGPQLLRLSSEKRAAFDAGLTAKVKELSPDGRTMGNLVTNELTAVV